MSTEDREKRADIVTFSPIVCNFDCNILNIFIETHFWDKLHVEEFGAPNHILGVCHQPEVLRVTRENVMSLVRAFNDLICDTSEFSQLYSEYLRQLEKKMNL